MLAACAGMWQPAFPRVRPHGQVFHTPLRLSELPPCAGGSIDVSPLVCGCVTRCVRVQDEISTGLDSATTFQIVRNLRDLCHLLGATIMVALLQPAPEVFDLFDDVCLLAEGGRPAPCSMSSRGSQVCLQLRRGAWQASVHVHLGGPGVGWSPPVARWRVGRWS